MLILLIFLVNLIYALVSPISKVALQYSTPMFLAAFRMMLAGFLTLIYQLFFVKEKLEITKKSLMTLVFGGVLSIYVAGILEFCSLENLASSKIGFLYNLYPMAAALISYLIIREKLSSNKWMGLLIGFLGALPLLLSTFQGDVPLHRYFGVFSLSEIAVLAGIFACPLGWIPVQIDISNQKYSTNIALGVTQIIGGIIALLNSFLLDTWDPIPVFNLGNFLLSSIVLTIFSNIIANILYIELLKRYTYTLIAFSGFLTAFLTAFFDWVLFGYGINFNFYLSTVISLVGFYLFYKEEFKLGKT